MDITDFNTMSSNFDPLGANTLGHRWEDGNFDGDEDIDITDFNILAANFAPLGYGSTRVVPEPSVSVGVLLGCLAWGLLARTRLLGKHGILSR